MNNHPNPVHNSKLLLASLIGCLGLIFVGVLYGNAYSSQFIPIPVPKNIIYAGQVISENLLRNRQVPPAYLARVNVITNSSDLIGKTARTTLMPSLPIPANHITEPDVVSSKRSTIMHYFKGALHISVEVIPLHNAKVGEPVRARNMRSGIVISGTAQSNGSILASGSILAVAIQ